MKTSYLKNSIGMQDFHSKFEGIDAAEFTLLFISDCTSFVSKCINSKHAKLSI